MIFPSFKYRNGELKRALQHQHWTPHKISHLSDKSRLCFQYSRHLIASHITNQTLTLACSLSLSHHPPLFWPCRIQRTGTVRAMPPVTRGILLSTPTVSRLPPAFSPLPPTLSPANRVTTALATLISLQRRLRHPFLQSMWWSLLLDARWKVRLICFVFFLHWTLDF